MSEKNDVKHETVDEKKPAADRPALADLEVQPDEADKVKGGFLRISGDPCEGGEYHIG